MADESLDKSYVELIDGIVLGATRTHPDWIQWFQDTPAQAHFETRVRQVFEERGHIPSPTQFFRAKDDILADNTAREAEATKEATKTTKEK